jgi:hypothetical protein
MKMSTEQWWNDTDRDKWKSTPVPLSTPQISTGWPEIEPGSQSYLTENTMWLQSVILLYGQIMVVHCANKTAQILSEKGRCFRVNTGVSDANYCAVVLVSCKMVRTINFTEVPLLATIFVRSVYLLAHVVSLFHVDYSVIRRMDLQRVKHREICNDLETTFVTPTLRR